MRDFCRDISCRARAGGVAIHFCKDRRSAFRRRRLRTGGPPVGSRRAAANRLLSQGQTHVDVAARGVGVGTYLMGGVDESLGIRMLKARQRYLQIGRDAEAPLGTWTDADRGGDRRISG